MIEPTDRSQPATEPEPEPEPDAAHKLLADGPDSATVDDLLPSPNIGARRCGAKPDLLVLHYTGLPTAQRALEVLSDPACEVSCHYLVDIDGRITQMVREADRAWHAGVSVWQDVTDINSCSIGIEIQNPGHSHGLPPFPDCQMAALEALCRDIIARRRIAPERVLAHSDIAPGRKQDPGENFDWQRLAAAGIGHWASPHPPTQSIIPPIDPQAPDARVRACQDQLTAYGYKIPCHGLLDHATIAVISAFQRHFRQARIDGLPDPSTLATLEDLLAALPRKPATA